MLASVIKNWSQGCTASLKTLYNNSGFYLADKIDKIDKINKLIKCFVVYSQVTQKLLKSLGKISNMASV